MADTQRQRRGSSDHGTSVDLRDGSSIDLRPVTADDRPLVTILFDGVSPDARRFRFFQPMPVLTRRLLDELSDVDHDRHVAWLAIADGRPAAEARYVRLRDESAVAEVALTVADDQRRRGLGRLLIQVLGVVAASEGVTAFSAAVLAENRASTALLRGLGIRLAFADGELSGRGPTPVWPHDRATASSILAAHARVRRRPRIVDGRGTRAA